MKIRFQIKVNLVMGPGNRILLYHIKHSRPGLKNLVCELSSCMDGANFVDYKEVIRVIRFTLETNDNLLKLNANLEDENCE
jgi:hypothetical protein